MKEEISLPEYETGFYKKLRATMTDWFKSKDGSKNKWAEYLMLAPDLFYLLCKLSTDKTVPAKEKAKLILIIAYFISPVDLMPEGILGPIGYLDDIALTAYGLNSIINNVGSDVVIKYWAGEGDVLKIIQHILEVADEMVGSGLWKRIVEMFE